MSTWELLRNWEIVRYLVYYLVENFISEELVYGKNVLDFSAGMGDLSEYIYSKQPNKLITTSPDLSPPPHSLDGKTNYAHVAELPANHIDQRIPHSSIDVFLARMVFQFPTVEFDHIDMDGMLAQVYNILRPGGRIIICSHEFMQLDDFPEDWDVSLNQYFSSLPSRYSGKAKEHIVHMIEMVQTIGLPPRESVHGSTGFGLKGLMAVDSFVKAGFHIEEASEIEDFTFPVGVSQEISERKAYYDKLARRVFDIKRAHILSPLFDDKYARPSVLKAILREINQLHTFVTVPIFRIQAIKV